MNEFKYTRTYIHFGLNTCNRNIEYVYIRCNLSRIEGVYVR